MALANVGCCLARDPALSRPVLLVDWDLEAPGLHRYLRKQVTTAFQRNEDLFNRAPGLIDLFVELRKCVQNTGDASRGRQEFEKLSSLLDDFSLDDYIIKTDIPRLHFLKAGRFDEHYAAKITSFNWPALYDRSPYLLRTVADRLARVYSFVVIDSRTGLSDTSGICAMLMPEMLVTVFTPNRQSLLGVVDVVREAAQYRASRTICARSSFIHCHLASRHWSLHYGRLGASAIRMMRCLVFSGYLSRHSKKSTRYQSAI
jgi:hypothetical protein